LRWDSRSAEAAATPEDIVAAVLRPGSANALLVRLQNPSDARFLIRDRMPIARRAHLLRIDAPEAKLQEYVVLVWPTKEKRERAQAVLQRDKIVLNVAQNERYRTSTVPLDPLYPWQSAFRWNQTFSGVGSAWTPVLPADEDLNQALQQTWTWTHGTAYVALLDTGIELTPPTVPSTIHPDIEFLFRPHFSQNVFTAEMGKVDELYGLANGLNLNTVSIGHGTHVAGIIAADTNRPGVQNSPPPLPPTYYNPAAEGISGVCWFCSLMIQKITVWEPPQPETPPNVGPTLTLETVAMGLYRTSTIGAQVASMSFGLPRPPGPGLHAQCAEIVNRPPSIVPVCIALEMAVSRDVLMFAAVGNRIDELVQFPANEPSVVPVAGLDRQGNHWIERDDLGFPVYNTGSTAGTEVQTRGIAALARDVPSTFYRGRSFNNEPQVRCADTLPLPDDQLGIGYGRCTGTSMSTPYVAGIGALLRSLDPLRRANDIALIMRTEATNATTPNDTIGFGRPDPKKAVDTLRQLTNGLTPLFSFRNPTWGDRFYTVVPQMASAATQDTMVWRDAAKDFQPYLSEGQVITGYNQFPDWEGNKGIGPIPRAQLWVFSGPKNLFNAEVELLPLFRLSYACYSTPPVAKPACTSNGRHIDHAFSTNLVHVHDWNILEGYVIDGIEGYLVPPSQPQPLGSTAVYRGFRSGDGDWAIFPASQYFLMQISG
jgi:subtilisin family serine protease